MSGRVVEPNGRRATRAWRAASHHAMSARRSLEDQLEDLDGLDLRDLLAPRDLSLAARRLRALERVLSAVAVRLGSALRDGDDAEVDELVYDWVCLSSALDHIRTEMGGPNPS